MKACVADRAICLDQWAPEGYLSKRNTELDLCDLDLLYLQFRVLTRSKASLYSNCKYLFRLKPYH